jgi:hypothetical protein
MEKMPQGCGRDHGICTAFDSGTKDDFLNHRAPKGRAGGKKRARDLKPGPVGAVRLMKIHDAGSTPLSVKSTQKIPHC